MKVLTHFNSLLPIAVASLILGVTYTRVQQLHRIGANIEQIQTRNDIPVNNQHGVTVVNISGTGRIKLCSCLTPFVFRI